MTIKMIIYVLVIIIVALMGLREKKELKPSRMWIQPILFIYLTFSGIKFNLTVGSILLYVVCLVLGLAIGFIRGKLQKIRINPDSGKITTKGSILWIIIVFWRSSCFGGW